MDRNASFLRGWNRDFVLPAQNPKDRPSSRSAATPDPEVVSVQRIRGAGKIRLGAAVNRH